MDYARLVAEITATLSLRFGSGVAAWCAAVPALADEVAGRWGLTLGQRYDYGASSVVLHCRQAGGARAVLKLSPDPPFRAIAPIIAISRIGNPGREQAVAELLTLSR